MGSYPEQLMEERDTLSAAIETTVTKAGESGNGLSDDDKKAIETRQARVSAIDSELTIIAAEQDSQRKANEFAAKFMRTPKPPAEEREAHRKSETTGRAFVGSEEFRSYDFHGKVGVEFTEEGAWFEQRAPLMTTDLPKMIGTGTFAIAEPNETTPLFGLIGSEQVSSGSFEYVSYTLVNNADVVPEGAVKPESELVENIVPGALETIAHWTQVTRQTLEDANRVRSIIDGKLKEGVNKKVHDQIVAAFLAADAPDRHRSRPPRRHPQRDRHRAGRRVRPQRAPPQPDGLGGSRHRTDARVRGRCRTSAVVLGTVHRPVGGAARRHRDGRQLQAGGHPVLPERGRRVRHRLPRRHLHEQHLHDPRGASRQARHHAAGRAL